MPATGATKQDLRNVFLTTALVQKQDNANFFFAMSISNLARFSKEKCEGEIDRSVVTGPRRSCRVATCAQWAEVAVTPLMILLNAQDRAAERSAQRAGAGLACSRNGSALQHEFGFAC